MTSEEVQQIIKKELESHSDLTSLQGVNLNDCLIKPKKETYISSIDESIKFELWTVFEETLDRKGYKITFDESDGTFGLGMMTNNDLLMDIGTHGTFLDTLRGM
ncbi:hypothetical protein [Roseivirga pacifica]|uniref:hypothetical protein n=1 Tax=Roseivirga pacifica TaxID=1267423 RepID=UPI003BACB79D|tara:strand:- start:220 stop:531 length:312 start_codon:yes stop_codon:yes gene_type:complete